MRKTILNKREGFTLIEIVIVLAIAALILIIVFLAIAGAQRARRDEANVEAAGKVLSAMETYASNHDGTYPTQGTDLTAPGATYLNNITDSQGGTPFFVTGPDAASDTADHRIVYGSGGTGYVCGSATIGTVVTPNALVAGTAPNQAAVSYWSEKNGSALCKSNK